MIAASRQLMRAAHHKTPRDPHRIYSWTGDKEAFDVVAARLESVYEWWYMSTPIEARRMFLVLPLENSVSPLGPKRM